MRNLLLKQIPTMTVPKWSWRKSPRPEKSVVICTRLILQAAIGAVKKHEIQRGSVRTICCCKCPSRTTKGGEDLLCLQFRYMPLPHQAYNSYLLTKINDDCCSDTCSRQSQMQTYNSNKKRMLPRKAASSYQLLGSVLVHFQQDLE